MKAGEVGAAAGAKAAEQVKKPFGPALRQAAKAAATKAAPPAAVAKQAAANAAETLARGRAAGDAAERALAERRRGHDEHERKEEERAPAPQQPPAAAPVRPAEPSPAPPPSGRDLAATVEKLALQLERREAAEGPSLELAFGAALSVRLTRGPRGVEVLVAGDGAAARQAKAELPQIVRALRARGVRVARAEVRPRR